MPVTPAAKALKDALDAGANIKALADSLMAEIAPATSGVIDVGANVYLAVTPGYGPLSDPHKHFFVLPEIN